MKNPYFFRNKESNSDDHLLRNGDVLNHYKGIRINMNYAKISTSLMVLLMTTASLGSYRIGFDKYHNFAEMTDYLKKITNEFSNISSLYSIGKSVLSKYTLCFMTHNHIF